MLNHTFQTVDTLKVNKHFFSFSEASFQNLAFKACVVIIWLISFRSSLLKRRVVPSRHKGFNPLAQILLPLHCEEKPCPPHSIVLYWKSLVSSLL